MTMRHRRWIQGAAGCALLAAVAIALGAIGLYSWINSMVPQGLKATVLPSGSELALIYEDDQGRSLEILEVIVDPELRSDLGQSIPLSGPRLSTDGKQVAYDLPEGIDPSSRLMIHAPDGWASSVIGPLPASRGVPLEGQPRKTRERVASAPGIRSKPRPSRQEVQGQTNFTLHSARVVASGRAVQLEFLSDEAPSDPTTFVDRHLSKLDQLTLSGAKTRKSLNFAGANVARGQDAVYRLSSRQPGAAVQGSQNHTGGEDLLVFAGEDQIGRIEAFHQNDAKLGGMTVGQWFGQELTRVLNEGLPRENAIVERLFLRSGASDRESTPAHTDGPQSYRLTVSGPGGPITTEPIPYLEPVRGFEHNNAIAAAQALRRALGYDKVFGHLPERLEHHIELIFERDGCPVWPIQAVTVTEASHPELLHDEAERNVLVHSVLGLNSLMIWFQGGAGCQELDLSIQSSKGAEGAFQDSFHPWREGHNQYRWVVTWYIDDPAEVIPYGEELTVSGPKGLVRGGRLDPSNRTVVFSGDESAAFTNQAVQNESWAGPDGDLSGDLCWVTDPALGVDNGWGRWRSDPPPAEWALDSERARSGAPEDQVPIRIAYVDEEYDGSNGPPRLNDPSRPYRLYDLGAAYTERAEGEGYRDLQGGDTPRREAILTPRLVLLKKGQTHLAGGDPAELGRIHGLLNGTGASWDNPAIISTYWMNSDGPEPSEPTVFQGTALYYRVLAFEHDGPRGLIYHGLVFHGGISDTTTVRDQAVWDCVFAPSRFEGSGISWDEAYRCSVIRTTIYDKWRVEPRHTSGIYVGRFDGGVLDQSALIRNGFTYLSGGYDGELRTEENPDGPTYMDVLGSDVTRLPLRGSPHVTSLSHNMYINSRGGENLYLNSFGMQTSGISFMLRSSSLVYGCVHYREGDYAQQLGADQGASRRTGTSSRRNVVLEGEVRAPYIRSVAWHMPGWSTSTGTIIEDNLLLGGYRGRAIEFSAVGLLSTEWFQIARHNTVIDRFLTNTETDHVEVSPTFHMAFLRNLVVRTGAIPEEYTLALVQQAPWPGGFFDENLYIDVDPSLGRGFLVQRSFRTFDTWRSSTGWDSRSQQIVGSLQTSRPQPAGGRDLLIEYLASRVSGVSTEADALMVFRSRLPGHWDDATYAPLGAGDASLVGFVESAYRPLGLDGLDDGYYGAIDYRGEEPQEPLPGQRGEEPQEPLPGQGVSQKALLYIRWRRLGVGGEASASGWASL